MWKSLCLAGFVLSLATPFTAQDIDSNPLVQRRSFTTIADQISDPSERSAFLDLFRPASPTEMLARISDCVRPRTQSRVAQRTASV